MPKTVKEPSELGPQDCGQLNDPKSFLTSYNVESVVGQYIGFADHGKFRQYNLSAQFLTYFQPFYELERSVVVQEKMLELLASMAKNGSILQAPKTLGQIFTEMSWASKSTRSQDIEVHARFAIDLLTAYLHCIDAIADDSALTKLTDDQAQWLADQVNSPVSRKRKDLPQITVQQFSSLQFGPFKKAIYRRPDLPGETPLEAFNRAYIHMRHFVKALAPTKFKKMYLDADLLKLERFRCKHQPMWMSPNYVNEARPEIQETEDTEMEVEPSTSNSLEDEADLPVESFAGKVLLNWDQNEHIPQGTDLDKAVRAHYLSHVEPRNLSLPPASQELNINLASFLNEFLFRDYIRELYGFEQLCVNFWRIDISLSDSGKSFVAYGFGFRTSAWDDIMAYIEDDDIATVTFCVRPFYIGEQFEYESGMQPSKNKALQDELRDKETLWGGD